jgi:hypothetical protein
MSIYFQADYIDEAEKSNENPTAWNETYKHAIQQVCLKLFLEKKYFLIFLGS